MKATPVVSVVIPCYNLGAYIEEAIASVFAQTFTDYEIIIVDDGSTDNITHAILKKLESTHPELKVFYKSNSGLAQTRNYGIERSKGEFIVCLDADDVLEPEYLEQTYQALESDKSGKYSFVTTWLKEFGVRENIWRTSDYSLIAILQTNVVHAASMFRKSVWKEVGGYKTMVAQGYEDWDFWLSQVERGYKWLNITAPLFRYRIRENSMLADAREKHQMIFQNLLENHQDLFNKHATELLIANATSINGLHADIKDKNKALEYVQDELAKLNHEYLVIRDQLDAYNASKIIKVANIVRAVLRKGRGILSKVLRGLNRRIRSLIPSAAKRVARKAVKTLYPHTVIKVKNEAWPAHLPLVSVISPYYNQAETFQETVNSILNQTFQNIEYIIVDDGSTPVQAAALDNIKDDRVTVHHLKENIGQGSPAAARNYGVERAKGKYIVCLDSDDLIDPTYIEKCLYILESNPKLGLVTSDTQTFGVTTEIIEYLPYSAKALLNDNRVTTAAMYRREAWEKVGGYKEGISYEDWEFWISLAEQGYVGQHIPEKLFIYRVAKASRFTEDRKRHRANVEWIRSLHPGYKRTVRRYLRKQSRVDYVMDASTAFINLKNRVKHRKNRRNIMIAVPWLTFGGAETLIYNYCREINDNFNMSFVTGLESKHEWQYKFAEISPDITHLPNLTSLTSDLAVEIMSNLITSRQIDILHIIHTDFVFRYLDKLKRRFPDLRIVVTMFNDRVSHFQDSIAYEDYIDTYVSDNGKVADNYRTQLKHQTPVTVIPNGINCYDDYSQNLFDRTLERQQLGLGVGDMAVFFVGRLSEEKNPDVFIEAARSVFADPQGNNVKFFVIGDGAMRERVERLIAECNNDNITYLGYKAEVAHYLSAADVFVLPSSIEGFPLSILEAMAMEVAVIASDVGAVREILDDGKAGFVVTSGSAAEIMEIIIQLRGDTQLLNKVKQSGRNKVESTYSNIILGKNYTTLYKSLSK